MKTHEEAIFYREWIPLPKAEFNILSMLAEQGGSFSGNYADMMRYLGVTVQNRNRQALRAAIESLTTSGYITHESSGRTHTLTVLPKATEIPLPADWVRSVLRHDYKTENVAAAQVLKVFLWVAENEIEITTYGSLQILKAQELNAAKGILCMGYVGNVLFTAENIGLALERVSFAHELKAGAGLQ